MAMVSPPACEAGGTSRERPDRRGVQSVFLFVFVFVLFHFVFYNVLVCVRDFDVVP